MVRRLRPAVWVGALLCPAVAGAQGGIPEATLAQLKAATVFIKVTTAQGEQTGSGFLLEKQGPLGLIVTNAHVVQGKRAPAQRIAVVLHSGTRDELALDATLAGADPDRDLAVLTVRSERLPEPLDVQSEINVRETLPVFILGFPFGEILATSKRNPAMTIARGAVSSIRRDDDDNVVFLQIDGGIDPGNSGGPIVNEAGALVGISVAKLSGSQIGLAIPKQQLVEMLQGRVASVRVKPVQKTAEQAVCEFAVSLIDPRHHVREVHVLTVPKAALRQAAKPALGQPVAADMASQALTLTRSEAVGRVSFSLAAGPPPIYVFQIKCVRSDGKTVLTGPAELNAASGTPPGMPGPGDLARDDRPNRPAGLPGRSKERPGGDSESVEFPASITAVALAGGGRHIVVHMAQRAEAVVYDLQKREQVLTIPAADDALVAGCQDRVLVLTKFDGRYSRWSLNTLKKEKEGALPLRGSIKTAAMGCASRGPLLLHWAVGTSALDQAFYSVIDVSTMQAATLNAPRGQGGPGGPRFSHTVFRDAVQIRAAANGNVFGMWATGVSPSGVETLILGRTPTTAYQHESAGYVAPTADGLNICTARGYYSSDLVRKRSEEPCLPTCHAAYYLSLSRDGVEVRECTSGRVCLELPPLTEFMGKDWLQGHSKLTLDQRFLCVPQEQILVTIPPTDDRLVLRRLDLQVPETKDAKKSGTKKSGSKKADAGTGKDQRTGKSPGTPPADATPAEPAVRTWTDKTGTFRTEAALLGVENGKVRLRKANGAEIQVPLDQLSDADAEFVRGPKKE